jgi:hypothetical protein
LYSSVKLRRVEPIYETPDESGSYPGVHQSGNGPVSASTRDDEHQLAGWRSGGRLNDCDVPERHIDRVKSAVQRLFPRIAQGSASNYIEAGDNFRKARRATSPDYIDRYFALTVFSVALMPPSSDAAACARAERLIRRASSYSEELDSVDAAAVLRALLRRLPLTPNSRIESAASAWIAVLLAKAPTMDPSEVFQLLERPPEQTSPLHYLLRATRLITTRSGSDQQWFSELVNRATAVAWNRFATHVRLADNAPIEPVGQLLNWLEEPVGPAAVRE